MLFIARCLRSAARRARFKLNQLVLPDFVVVDVYNVEVRCALNVRAHWSLHECPCEVVLDRSRVGVPAGLLRLSCS
jgi:hypothetical protein